MMCNYTKHKQIHSGQIESLAVLYLTDLEFYLREYLQDEREYAFEKIVNYLKKTLRYL